MAPSGECAAAPSGDALRAIDPSAHPRSWRTCGPCRLRRQSQPDLLPASEARHDGPAVGPERQAVVLWTPSRLREILPAQELRSEEVADEHPGWVVGDDQGHQRRRVAKLFGLQGEAWMRHANPLSVWTRFAVL